MKHLEISGKTVEEAIQHALEQLGISREEVDVTVLKEGKPGILGLGTEEARVRVTPLVPMPDKKNDVAEVAKDVLETLLSMMEMAASVAPHTEPVAEGEEIANAPVAPHTIPSAKGEEVANASVALDVKGDDLGILIGRRGQTLACLQYIVRLIVAHQTKTWVPITIDVEGYKQRRYQSLRALAWRMAELVKTKQAPFRLEPMPAYERRIIHLALADHPDVTTESVGEGEARKVVIMPKEQ